MSPLLRIFASRSATPVGKIFFPSSPCPSPTPLFQQLYQAIGQIDRMTQESPEALLTISRDKEKVIQRSNSFTMKANENAIECVNNRRQSYPLNISMVPTKVDIRISKAKKS